MKSQIKSCVNLLVCLLIGTANASINQTATTTPILSDTGLPFRVVIQQANFTLPVGLHSGVFGVYQGMWVFIAGRMNGLHGFGGDPFPPDEQNVSIYVVNPSTGATYSRLLTDPSSGLNQQQIDSLSVTDPQGYQEGETLFMTGGYGIDTASATYGTKTTLTAIYLPGIIQWVMNPNNSQYSVIQNIRQISNPVFQIAGGKMFKLGNATQLVFGQDMEGPYTSSSNGIYSQQVRQFQITTSHGQLGVTISNPKPQTQDPDFRRRDLNIVPVLLNNNNHLQYGLVAYAGVFTVAGGVWNVPVVIDSNGNPTMADPNSASSFKQGMNQYTCANVGLYSRKYLNMYNVFFGGISYGYYSGGVFETDDEIPFINQVTTIQIDRNSNFTQYLMDGQYPVILSTHANPGNPLLFGAGAHFIANTNIQRYPNGVINLDSIRGPTVIGYIVGGIQSTLPNTNFDSDSAASPYVFSVTLVPT